MLTVVIELYGYLKDSVQPRVVNFDILVWWKMNAPKYPIVARLTRDVLSIPVSTVAFESVFSTGGRVLGKHRCSISSTTLEAIMCAQDWLRSEYHGQSSDDDGTLATIPSHFVVAEDEDDNVNNDDASEIPE